METNINNSITPRTDAERYQAKHGLPDAWVVPIVHAEELERELTETRKILAEKIKTIDGLMANTPDCGACAEGLWCGSTMHQHTCGIPNTGSVIEIKPDKNVQVPKFDLLSEGCDPENMSQSTFFWDFLLMLGITWAFLGLLGWLIFHHPLK